MEDVEGAPHPAYSATVISENPYMQNYAKWQITVYADTIDQLKDRVTQVEMELLKTQQERKA